jgi:hypothetical protein
MLPGLDGSYARNCEISGKCRVLTWLIVAILITAGHSTAQISTSVILSSSVNPSNFGQPVTLMATITPSSAAGKVTFYDGTVILGSAPVSGGAASLATIGIGYGQRQLTARYIGGSNYLAAVSPALAEKITTKPGGSFTLANTNALGGANARAMAVADLNHDGYPDIVAATFNGNFPSALTILVFISNGDGTFKSPLAYSAGDPSITQIAIADVDLDGNQDVIATGASGVYELKGNSDGTLQGASSLISYTYDPSDARAVRIADVNSDGYPDLIVTDPKSAMIEVQLGRGDGTFQTAITAATSSAGPIQDLAVGDFNGDGIPDAAVSATTGNSVIVFIGEGGGTFAEAAVYPISANSITIADVNQDGYLDILGGAGLQNVLLGNGNGAFRNATASALDPPLAANGLLSTAVTDFNGDGIADLIDTGIDFYLGNGDGTFRNPVSIYAPATGIRALGDFNGDGIVDIALTDANGSPISIYSGALSPILTLTASPNPANEGQDVVLSAGSSFADATGTVSFTDTSTGTNLGNAPLSNGSAAFRVVQPARGNHTYQGAYGGNSKYAATDTPVISVTVQQTIEITLSASPNPALPGQEVTLTAKLSTFPGNAKVIFMDGVTPLGYQELFSGPASNQPTLTTVLAAGVHQLRVVFPAYQGFESTSASYTETVTSRKDYSQ